MDNEIKGKIIDLYKAANGRTFATPKTSDDIEADLPSMAELAQAYHAEEGKTPRQKTKSDILEKGSLLDKLRLLFSSEELSGFFDATEKLTREEKESIKNSIQTDEDKEIANKCFSEYRTISVFGGKLRYFYKVFQTSFSILAALLNKWDSYNQTAERLTKMYQELKDGGSFVDLRAFVKSVLDITNLEGATLLFDEANGRFYVDVDKRGGLYSQIKKEAKYTTEDLSNFKAYVVVAEEYIETSTIRFMPLSIELSCENAMFERYQRYMVKNLDFFRSELNERKDNGETITPEQEKKAIIPDYNEIAFSRTIYNDCKKGINKL